MTALLKLDHLFLLTGLTLLIVAVLTCRDRSNPRRWSSGLFWALWAVIYLVGDSLPPVVSGLIVIMLAALGGLGGVSIGKHGQREPAERQASAARLGNRLFLPILAITVLALVGSLTLKDVGLAGWTLVETKNLTLVSVGIGALVGLAAALWMTRERPMQAVREARRLLETMGPAVILPQMLATLGLLFADAGVGKAVAQIATSAIPVDNPLFAAAAYALGMALFTMVMGNAFAAFPVMTAGIGIPILLGMHHGDAAVMAAIGMFCGYCGTLMTPMAANFNIIPAALLELKDKNAVIRAQWPTALLLLAVNIVLLKLLMFR
ncbi:DUF979 domain-containing protein [Pelomonas aquatica]|jgi:uncharacterized membrane protein|uniref:DUF979 domain-containing protein n=1 Tax=Pelomonas aquatica TaxID=431058 RepID=A0A9X4LCW2_9BURK|nr:DUF979 domain-containing protein [Pelomonas aquatica]MCY4753845.1 DUF979 domain-containing protein [Pelomonas aquatica]MDG0861172.1 DUF979 domain-containing protein [Pelomonas aquatica]